MKKKIFFMFLSVCLMISCFSFAYADNPNVEENGVYIDYVLASADEHDYSEYELVMSAIDDVTYEVAMPDGRVVGTLYMDNSEKVAVPYSTSQEVNWRVPRDDIAHSTTFVDTTYGSRRFEYSIHAEPSGSTKFGFYCNDNRSYYWFPGLEGSASGFFPVRQGFGLVAFAIKNESGHTIRYTGSYTV